MTPGQRAAYAKLPKVDRWRRPRPRHFGLAANDYAAEFEAAGGTFEDFEAGVTLAELAERRSWTPTYAAMTRPTPPTSYAPMRAYVPVPWDYFDSADRYHCEGMPS